MSRILTRSFPAEEISLRKLSEEDSEKMLEWMHNGDINRVFQFDFAEMSKESTLAFIHNSWRKFEEKSSLHYAITDNTNEYLGTISLKNIDHGAKNAEYAIVLRGCAQGKGAALNATYQLLKIAFEELELERVYLNVCSDNNKAIALYEKAGFFYEGEFRRHLFIRGNISSLKWYSMLKKEYRDKFLGGGGEEIE